MIKCITVFRAAIMAVVLMAGLQAAANAQSGVKDEVEAGDLPAFFASADSMVVFPPYEDSLEIKRTKLIDKKYVSFIGMKGSDKVFIVAITLQPIKDVTKEIATSVQFQGGSPRAGKVTSWGYIYDRNDDGKVDYMALLAGAGPVEPVDFPDDYPPRNVLLSDPQMELFANRCRLVFNHWADDNWDGKLDGVAHVDLDPVRDWIQRRIVVRSTGFNGKFDEVWAFRDRIDNRQDSVTHTKNSVPYLPLRGPQSAITPKTFAETDGILNLINRAIAVSAIRREQLPKFGTDYR